jgi:phage tail sheath protein FI
MPEYLAPGVYLEEVDSSAKPIEGVSTSTAGMVGVAERGPVNVPILVTSMGDFERWFGGTLAHGDFGAHCYLPHAVEGFFSNGGKRLYVVRVAADQAAPADGALFWRNPANAAIGETVLLRGAAQGTGMAATVDQQLYVLSASNLAAGQVIRVGDGSSSEYMTIGAGIALATQHVTLNAAVTRAHAAGNAISEHPLVANATLGGAKTLAAPGAPGDTELLVATGDALLGALPAADQLPWLVELTRDGVTDLVVATQVRAAGAGLFQIVLNQPLQGTYPTGQAVVLQRSSVGGARTLAVDAMPGATMVFANVNGAGNAVIELDRGGAAHEAFLAGALGTVAFAQPLVGDVPPHSRFEQVALADDGAIAVKGTTAALAPGAQVVPLNNREGLAVGQVVRVGSPAIEEFATIAAVPGERRPAPDAGTIVLATGLSLAHGPGAQVAAQVPPAFPGGGNAAARVVLGAVAGSTSLLLTRTAGWAAGQFARITTPDGTVYHVRATGAGVAATPSTVQLTANLSRNHPAGSPVVEREVLFDIEALDVGSWGNRLTVSARREERGLAQTRTAVLTAPSQFTVESLTGIEPGSLIELRNPAGGGTAQVKVMRIDRSNNAVILDNPGLSAAVLAALGPVGGPLEVRSIEFSLTVNLRRRPDPAVPSRNTMILASESFRNLSLDHRHSRYVQQVVGHVNGPLRLEDNRPEGESAFIRVDDRLQGVNTEVIRPGPEALVDLLPGGIVQPARHPLANGSDALATTTDATYLGSDNADPRLRTGLTALRNLPEISLVAIPGQTSANLQAGIISHCENARYRFAVLDAADGEASLNDVRQQRQQFDTKYAALYYPWLTIPDPTPPNLANVGTFALPPAGHVLGLIARVDVERGVHKAPANEVVRGITGVQRTLQKGEHDILNPSPVNINVVRDFRPDGRGIRLFGARCITSDQEHKYVNVRRLLIFLEQSIERGLQWVVFEPNAEPLWARVRQSVSNFLTDVWRAGALEGTEPGQGFFVKCDLTTMTQSDIDNGRLICVIGVAPVKPAEFVIIRIGLTTRTTDSE